MPPAAAVRLHRPTPAPVLCNELPSAVPRRRDRPPAPPLGAHRGADSGLYATAVSFPLAISFTTTSLCGCFRLRYSAASMAMALRSRYERGLSSIDIANCAPG